MSPSVFPGLSGSSLRGCDTKSYKASIMKSKAGAKGADDIQTVGHLAARAPGILSQCCQQNLLRVNAMEPKNMEEGKTSLSLQRIKRSFRGFSFFIWSSCHKKKCVCVCAKKQLKKRALLLKKKKIMIFNGIPAVTVLLDLGITCQLSCTILQYQFHLDLVKKEKL